MLKKYSFVKKFAGLVLAVLFIVGVFAGVSEARELGWNNDNTCPQDMTCGTRTYVWTLDYYCSVVSGDCAYDTRPYDEVPGGKGIFVPDSAQAILKDNTVIIVQTLPELYSIKSIKLSKSNFPLPYDTKFVFIEIAYERDTTGTERGSAFSNRVMWKTPKRLDYTISIDRGDVDGR
jgi:hypothetical protein